MTLKELVNSKLEAVGYIKLRDSLDGQAYKIGEVLYDNDIHLRYEREVNSIVSFLMSVDEAIKTLKEIKPVCVYIEEDNNIGTLLVQVPDIKISYSKHYNNIHINTGTMSAWISLDDVNDVSIRNNSFNTFDFVVKGKKYESYNAEKDMPKETNLKDIPAELKDIFLDTIGKLIVNECYVNIDLGDMFLDKDEHTDAIKLPKSNDPALREIDTLLEVVEEALSSIKNDCRKVMKFDPDSTEQMWFDTADKTLKKCERTAASAANILHTYRNKKELVGKARIFFNKFSTPGAYKFLMRKWLEVE